MKPSVRPEIDEADGRRRVIPSIAREGGCAIQSERAGEPPDAALRELIGCGPRVAALRREIASVAPLHSTVLLLGETGTGKGLVAGVIHRLSPRRDAPFVHVDCAALSPTIIESELFGHERGAFTGAVIRRRGRFELARAGTLFLDEIGDLEPRVQSKLLRVLEDRVYERVGGSRTLSMTARVVAATSRDLASAVAAGHFRPDLYYRLNVVPLVLPLLRERLEDLPLLLRVGLERQSRALGVPAPTLSVEAQRRLAAHPWPGNVRELLNVVERLVIRCSGRLIGVGELEPFLDAAPVRGAQLRAEASADCEARRRIAAALRDTCGNVARAARLLEIPRSTLRHRIERFGRSNLRERDP